MRMERKGSMTINYVHTTYSYVMIISIPDDYYNRSDAVDPLVSSGQQALKYCEYLLSSHTSICD